MSTTEQDKPFSVLMRRLLRLLHTVSATELKNQIRWLDEFRRYQRIELPQGRAHDQEVVPCPFAPIA